MGLASFFFFFVVVVVVVVVGCGYSYIKIDDANDLNVPLIHSYKMQEHLVGDALIWCQPKLLLIS